jgi:hypothetical protein
MKCFGRKSTSALTIEKTMKAKKTNNCNLKRFLFLYILIGLTAGLQSCMASKSSPQELGAYYADNYPAQKVNASSVPVENPREQNSVKKSAFWKSRSAEPPLDVEAISHRRDIPQSGIQEENASRFQETQRETLIPPDNQYSADDLASQNTSSMIEGKIFNLVEDAYRQRDYSEFVKLYSLFVESFPHSSQKGFLDEKRRNFFYRENLHVEKLQGAMLEISYPNAKSLEELNNYFERIRESGIRSIQINIVQFLGEPVFLFANPKQGEGYYFSNSNNLIVDDLLSMITKVAHSNDLKVFASFPLRHHPRLGESSVFLMDESWNAFQNKTTSNSKLDLLNPASKTYLINLVKELLQLDIDGIVLKDDFTYERNEGFSLIARNRYLTETGQPISFNTLFVPLGSKASGDYELLTGDEFQNVALWRTREITQLLWDLVDYINLNRNDFFVGLEVTPEMLLEQFDPLKWYSTGLHYLKDLNVDSFILKWRKYKSDHESDPKDYARAVEVLRNGVSVEKEIYLKIPLSQSTKNVIELNRKIDTHSEFSDEFTSIKMAIGPVDRVKRLDIVN